MSRLLFLCVGNAFQSPLLAALYNAEVKARDAPGIAFSAGLSNRRESPPTTPFLLEAVAQEVGDLPAVLEALKNHQPRPLKDLDFVAVDGVSYLYDPARSRGHLAQDARAIQTWLQPAPTTLLMQLAVKDSGYETWVEHGRPTLEDAAGHLVVAAYRREVAALRALMPALLPSEDGTMPSLVVLAPPPPARVQPQAAQPPRVQSPPLVQRVQPPPVERVQSSPVVQRVQSPWAQRIQSPPPQRVPSPPPAQAPSAEETPRPHVARKRTVVRTGIARSVVPTDVIVRRVLTDVRTDDIRADDARAERVSGPTSAPQVTQPQVTQPQVTQPQVTQPQPVRAPEAPKTRRKAALPSEAVAATIDPATAERAEVLEDVRAWIRAALPVRRPTLSRYGLWERAETHFGSWSKAVSAAGIPLAAEPLWQLPARDPELSFDILVEALPDAIVARLCSVTLAKVRRRRRDNGAPDPTRQLHRRVLATNRLDVVSDEVIATQLGVSTEAIAEVREAERLAATSTDDDPRPDDTSTPS